VATQPRMPCYKLGLKFGRMDVVRKFLVSGRPGIYFKVLKEGQVQVGDKIEIVSRDKNNVTVKDIVHLYITRDRAVDNIETMRRAIRISALPDGWKYEFQQNIKQLERGSDISYY